MREIKFRTWDKKDKRFSDEYLLNFYGIIYDVDYGELENVNQDDFELEQYTGLKDKNGKEIFEGDIITNGRDYATVVFDEGTFLAKTEKYYTTESVYDFDYCSVFEVIGNIHENPELLER